MRTTLFLAISLFASVLLTISSVDVYGITPQDGTKSKAELRRERKAAKEAVQAATTDSLLNLGHFKFVAERMVSSMGMGNSSLNGTYDVIIAEGKIDSHLPFFGKMNSANPGVSSGPMDFRATLINYKKSGPVTVDGKAYVTMNGKPEGSTNFYTLAFEVYGSGSAALNIMQQNGDSSAYYGYITSVKE